MGRPRKNPLTLEKQCPVCNKKFSVPFPQKHQIFCSRTCSNKSPDVIQKMVESQKKTSLEKYGVDHPMKSSNVVNTFKKSMMSRYGVESALKDSQFLEKSKLTKQLRYGDENYNNNTKREFTCVSKYGVKNYTQTEGYKEKIKQTSLEKYGVDHPSKSKQYKLAHCTSMFRKFLTSDRFLNFDPMFDPDEYNGVTPKFNKLYKFKCKRCNTISEYDISNGKPVSCVKCDKCNASYFQKEVYDYVRDVLGNDEIIIVNEKRILYPKELDIYIPSKNLAIECNGLFWHSEVMGKRNRTYHYNKTKQCLLKGIRLVHIFENEWTYKQNIVKSILKNILNTNIDTIYARKCKIVHLSKKETQSFLVSNHIQGDDRSSVKIGLQYNNEIVSVMTFGKSRFDKKSQFEIVRFCNKLNTNIVGGASKLFSHFVKTYNPSSIVSYNDLRYFDGRVYSKLGFKALATTPPSYSYIIDGYQKIKNRLSFQKHRLKNIFDNFDPNLTEWENMRSNGYDRIWDCGNTKWLWIRPSAE